MKLDFTILEICEILGADCIGGIFSPEKQPVHRIIIDSRSPQVDAHTLFVLFQGNKTNGAAFLDEFREKGGRFVLTQEEHSVEGITQLKVEDTLAALQTLAGVHREKFNLPVIGITGSNGKTTVKEWVHFLLKDTLRIVRSPKSYNSQIGVALSLLEITATDELGIFEAGISKPGEMEVLEDMIRPTLGIFTGIGDAHQRGFPNDTPDFAEKKAEKYKLFKAVETLYAWEGDQLIKEARQAEMQTIFSWTQDQNQVTLKNGDVKYTFEIPFGDEAAAKNAAIAFLLALDYGVSEAVLLEKLISLPAISMRMERIAGVNNSLLINDGYTLDRTALEIGMKTLLNNTEREKKMVFIGEERTDSNQSVLPDLEKMIADTNIRVIYICEETIDDLPDFVEKRYHSVDEFLTTPVELEEVVALFTGARNVGMEKIVNHYTAKKHTTQLVVDLAAMRDNLNYFREKIQKETAILAMVKAQSYGGGILEVARFLESESINYFGVAYADEGVTLRKGGITTPILVMNPESSAYSEMIAYDLEPSIYSLRLLDEFLHQLILHQRKNYPIHIKLETGMNRLGFEENDLNDLLATLRAQPEVYVKSIFSHLATADDLTENEFTLSQKKRFEVGSDRLEKELGYSVVRHLCNSHGILNHSEAHYDMVRLGIGLFGLMSGLNAELSEVVQLKSRISQIRTVNEGGTVGYGRHFRAAQKTRIGVVPVGYADGLRRKLSEGRWHISVRGKNYPIIGKICMDMFMIDLGEDHIAEGDEVIVFGGENTVMKMASVLDTIPYEILSAISARVKRVYADD